MRNNTHMKLETRTRLDTDLVSLTLEQGPHVKTGKTERGYVRVDRRTAAWVSLVRLLVLGTSYYYFEC